jgi:hypothetical protein
MKLKTILGFPTLIFVFCWILLFISGQSKMFRDPGSFSHTAIGAYMLETGRLISHDIFSFTRFGEPWIAQQWLGECVMAIIQKLAGFDGLLVFAVSLIALVYFILALRIECSGMNLALGAFILAFSLAAGSHHFHVRPHIATMLFMVVVYARLCDVESGRKDINSLLWLIPIFILWSNIHGGALGGLFTFLLVAAGWTLASLKRLQHPFTSRKPLIILWIVVLFCFAAPLINPYGLKLPATWLSIMSSGAVAQIIQEHASFLTLLKYGETSSYVTILILLLLCLFYLALLAGIERKNQRITWYIPLVWFLLSMSRIRHAPLFAMLSVVAIAEMFPYCRWVHRLGEKGLVTFRVKDVADKMKERSIARYILPALITGVALLFFHGSAQLPSYGQKWVKLDSAHWPVELIAELKAIEKNNPKGTPIFNDMLFGGFLIYHAPGLRVFMDDRCELYGDDLIIKYVKAQKSDFEEWGKNYGFNFALLAPDSNYRKYLDGNSNWRVIKRCRSAVLYQKHNMRQSGEGE